MKAHRSRLGFTLLELFTVVAMLALLTALLLPALGHVRQAVDASRCLSGLRQLGAAMMLYQGDHRQEFVHYRQTSAAGTIWYFGLETTNWTAGDGARDLDQTRGPLYPYVQSTGGIAVCHAFDYSSALWKPKYKGASWGYGYNCALGGGVLNTQPIRRVTDLAHPAQVVVFGDCAQVNTFQAPASASHPMVEEFYLIDAQSATIHFRHGPLANFLFADGHAAPLPMAPGTKDTRLPDAQIGRIAPAGSMEYLE